MGSLPKVWELIDRFKHICKSRGWWVSEYEDVINANGEYHNFLWARKIYPRTFKSVVSNHFCPIRDGLSYRIVNVSYTAWIFSEPPIENLISFVIDNPHLLRSTALYDLSKAYMGSRLCLKLNETESIVFREFEDFLEKEYGLNLINKLPPLPPDHLPLPERTILNI
ncbi:hypothetical protein KEJ14_01070 [Candidatus Bathyarchaeota archaeon]|nr:hypothetical protein [Candidatus Bathyarchaeota archaeon]